MENKKQKTAIMYGAGNIGRGFIGERFYLSGYHTVFVDINEEILNLMTADGCYPLYTTDGDKYKESIIKNISGVNGRDADTVAEQIAGCDIMATAVGVNVLPYIAGNIAAGIIRRYESGEKPLNIIICENLINCDKYLRKLILEHLEKIGADQKIISYFNESIGLIEASVGRMVPQTPDEIKAKNPLSVCVEAFCTLPVDADAIKGDFPELNGVEPKPHFELYIRRKLYMHNMSHAILAYLGFQKGYTYIWEAAEDNEIYAIAEAALHESAEALSIEYNADIDELNAHSADILSRFKNKLLGDTVLRVGKDTIRKLSPNDRLTGAYTLARKHGINAEHIYSGITAALKFNPPEDFDPQSHEVFEYAKEFGNEAAMKKYCNL